MAQSKSKPKKAQKQAPKEPKKVTFDVNKDRDFSEWFSQIVQKAELADLRYNVKGFVVFQPWSVRAMEHMYRVLESMLQERGHEPYWFPVVIPESYLRKESDHVEGFAPEVFWVTEHGAGEKFEERLALRPTSETAFHTMFSTWIRSHNDLPFKAYQRANVYRHETKATRAFLRSREFHWIETHCAFADEKDAMAQVKEDMEVTRAFLGTVLGIPHIFFKRPQWDKFAGAVDTFAADAIMPDGKVLQLPSTHYLGTNFSKPFGVTYTDERNEERLAHLTCFGPAVSRIFAGMVITHGDQKGLVYPFEVAPYHVVVTTINAQKDAKVGKKAAEIAKRLTGAGYRVKVDARQVRPGEKFYHWEMKGVPFRIELGPKEAASGECTLYRRDTEEKAKVKEGALEKTLEKLSKAYTAHLNEKAHAAFESRVADVKSVAEIQKALDAGKIARAAFCSAGESGVPCAERVEKEAMGRVRGTRIDISEKPKGNCAVCGKKASETVYIARQY